MSDTTQIVYRSLLAFLDPWPHLRERAVATEDDLLAAIRVALGEPRFGGAAPEDIDGWSLRERTRANARAFAVLDVLRREDRPADPSERGALLEYSGWGGIKPEELPEQYLPAEITRELRTYRDWYNRAAVDPRRAGPPPAIPSLAGIVTQYFTPHTIAAAMWRLLVRLGFQGGEVLEPSAGVGRFVRMAPNDLDIRWTLVEMDGVESDILRHVFPSALRFSGTFESFVKQNAAGARYNVIIGNPPYAQHAPYAGQDGIERSRRDIITYEHDYFVDRAARMLLPGGTLCLLIPAGFATDKGAERVALRTELAKRCHIDTMIFLPSRIFSGANLVTMILVATRRGRDLDEPLPEDMPFVEGRTLDDGFTPENSLGVWRRTNWRGISVAGEEGSQELVWPADDPAFGPQIDTERIVNATLRPLPAREVEHIRDALTEIARNQPDVSAAAGVETPTAEPAVAAVEHPAAYTAAEALAVRVGTFLREAQAEPERAETGREELLADLRAWVTSYGNPYAPGGLYSRRKTFAVAPFLGVFDRTGEVNAQALLQPLVAREEGYVGDAEDVGAVVRWFARARGYATYEDVVGGCSLPDPHEALLADESIAVEYAPEGDAAGLVGWIYYPMEEYTKGHLWPRYDRLRAMLTAEGLSPETRARYEQQLTILIDAINPARGIVSIGERPDATAGEIEVSIRSGFVPVEALAAFCLERDEALRSYRERKGALTFELRDGYLHNTLNLGGAFTNNVLAYWNRRDDVAAADADDARRGKRSARHVVRMGSKLLVADDVKAKMGLDEELEGDFVSWLRNNEDFLVRVLDRYNRTYRGVVAREYSTAPLGIYRMRNLRGYELRPTQNSAVRRLDANMGGIAALEVGVGKTGVGMGIVALLRQKGLTKRPFVLVPNSLMVNWHRELREWLPDYRVGVLGLTFHEDGTSSPDDTEARRAKWTAVRAGAYDVVLCSYSVFLDVDVTPKTKYDVLSEEYWLLRQLTIDSKDRAGEKVRAEELRSRIAELEDSLARNTPFAWNTRVTLTRSDQKEEKLTELRKQLRGIDGNTLSPTDRQRLREAMARAVGARKDLEDLQAQAAAAAAKGGRRRKAAPAPSEAEIAAAERAYERAQKDLASIAESMDVAVDIDATSMRSAPTVRDIEVARQEAEAWIADRSFRGTPPLAFWEDLDIDLLVVDEAHNFKNLWYAGSRYGQTIRFLGGGGDQMTRRAWDLFAKAKYLRKGRNDAGVVLLTGTPLKNSPLELYSMLSYVSDRIWRDRDIRNKEDFIDRFIHIEPAETLHPRKGYQTSPAALRFKNLDELYAIASQYIEVRTAREVVDMDIAAGRKPTLILPAERSHVHRIPMTEEQYAVYDALRAEAKKAAVEVKEAEDRGEVVGGDFVIGGRAAGDSDEDDFSEDDDGTEAGAAAKSASREEALAALARVDGNPRARMLVLMSRMDKAATDLALLNAEVWSDDITNKAKAVAAEIAKNPRCGHIVFVDYNELHPRFVEIIAEYAGVPRGEIATISGETGNAARRQQVADMFTGVPARPGQAEVPATINVLIGQSKVVGEGMNLQARTCALHHVTFPWEPATIRQRNGRGVRHGNIFSAVDVHYYLSLHSFDIYRWEMIQAKMSQQQALFGRGVVDADNPMAGMRPSIEELLVMFERDPEVAAKMLAELTEERDKRRREQMISEADKRIRSVCRLWGEIRRLRARLKNNPDPAEARRRAIDTDIAQRNTARLLEFPPDIVGEQMRQLLAAVPVRNALWRPSRNIVAIEGEPLIAAPLSRNTRTNGLTWGMPEAWWVTRIVGDAVYARRQGSAVEERLWSPFSKVVNDLCGLPAPGAAGTDAGAPAGGAKKKQRQAKAVSATGPETTLGDAPEAPPADVVNAFLTAQWDPAADAAAIEKSYTPVERRMWVSSGSHLVTLAPQHVPIPRLNGSVPADILGSYRDILWRGATLALIHALREATGRFALDEETLRGFLARTKDAKEGQSRILRDALTFVLAFPEGKSVVLLTVLQYLLLPVDSPWRQITPLLGTPGDRRRFMAALRAFQVTDMAGHVVSRTRVNEAAQDLGVQIPFETYRDWPAYRRGGADGEESSEGTAARSSGMTEELRRVGGGRLPLNTTSVT